MPQKFKALVYDVSTDVRRWEEFTRDALIDAVVRQAFDWDYGRRYADMPREQARVVRQTMLQRAAINAPLPCELQAILNLWRSWWRAHGDSVLMAREYA